MSEHDLIAKTKINTYNQCLQSASMYRNETCTIIKLGKLEQSNSVISETFWRSNRINILVMKKSSLEDMEIKLVRNYLRWLGHVSRVED